MFAFIKRLLESRLSHLNLGQLAVISDDARNS